MATTSRKPAVAGKFYPGSNKRLEQDIQNYLDNVEEWEEEIDQLYGVISPHAGYEFSGPIAAYSYSVLAKASPKHLIIIAPSHHAYISGFTIYPGAYYETPLGKIPINQELSNTISNNCSSVQRSKSGHQQEHSLEVQLPFIQYVLEEDFDIIPIIAGDVDQTGLDMLSEELSEINQKEEIVIVASSDLSHFHSYDQAVKKDRELINKLKDFEIDDLLAAHKSRKLEACGMIPINVLMQFALNSGSPQFKELNYRNSGDTTGEKGKVVGYLSAAIYE